MYVHTMDTLVLRLLSHIHYALLRKIDQFSQLEYGRRGIFKDKPHKMVSFRLFLPYPIVFGV